MASEKLKDRNLLKSPKSLTRRHHMYKYITYFKQDDNEVIYSVQFCNYLSRPEPMVFAAVSGNRVSFYECRKDGSVKFSQCYEDTSGDEFYTCCWTYDEVTVQPILLAAGKHGVVQIIRPIPKLCTSYIMAHANSVHDIKIHPSKCYLMLSASKDHSIRLWNIKTNALIAVFGGVGGHRDEVLSVDINSIGSLFVSCGIDHSVKIWRLNRTVITEAINKSRTFKSTQHRPSFPTLFEHYAYYTTRDIHTNYVDSVKWLRKMIMSKSCENRIVLWDPRWEEVKPNTSPTSNTSTKELISNPVELATPISSTSKSMLKTPTSKSILKTSTSKSKIPLTSKATKIPSTSKSTLLASSSKDTSKGTPIALASKSSKIPSISKSTPITSTSKAIPVASTSKTLETALTPKTTEIESTSKTVLIESTSKDIEIESTSKTILIESTSKDTEIASTSNSIPIESTSKTIPIESTLKATEIASTSKTIEITSTSKASEVASTSKASETASTSKEPETASTSKTSEIVSTSKTTDIASTSKTSEVESTSTAISVESTSKAISIESPSKATEIASTSKASEVASTSKTKEIASTSKTSEIESTSKTSEIESTSKTSEIASTSTAIPILLTSKVTPFASTSQAVPFPSTSESISLESKSSPIETISKGLPIPSSVTPPHSISPPSPLVIQKFRYDNGELFYMRFGMDAKKKVMAIGTTKGDIVLWNLDVQLPSDLDCETSRTVLKHAKCVAPIRCCCFSKDGKVLIASCDDGTIWRWDRME